MKAFPTNFVTEKNKKTGASPVWILKCPFPSTGTIYLSDQAFTVASWNGGVTTKSWVKSWGAIDENISGSELAASQVSDFALSVIIDPNAAPDINTILWTAANNIETTDLELYLWFIGMNPATDPPQKMWVGNIIDFVRADELVCQIRLVDQSVRVDKYVGTAIDAATYPNADPDDIGKIGNIGYGILKKVPALAVVAGALDYLDDAITATQTTLNLIDTSGFPSSGTIGIDAEDVQYTGKSATQLTGLTRGANSTTAAIHNRGAPVWEQKTNFTYEAFSHPIKQFDGVYAVGSNTKLKITSIVTLYTGNTGSQHPTWPNKAMIVVPSKITKKQAVSLLVNDGIAVNDAIAVVDTIAVNDGISVSDLLTVTDNIGVSTGSHAHTMVSPSTVWQGSSSSYSIGSFGSVSGAIANVRDGSDTTWFLMSTGGYPYTSNGSINVNFPTYSGPTPAAVFACITHESAYFGANAHVILQGNDVDGSNIKVTQKFYLGTTVPASISLNLAGGFGHADSRVYEIWLEINASATGGSPATGVAKSGNAYRSGAVAKSGAVTKSGVAAKSGTVTKTGTVIMSGNSVADTVIADKLVVNAQGYKDDASGTITGTANLLIERPDHIIKHLLVTYGSWPVANFYTNADVNFATKGYKFAGVITEKRKLKEWLTLLAFQCRCYYRLANNQAQLLWRPDTLSMQKSVTSNMIRMQEDFKTTTTVTRSPLEQVINKISIHYDRNWAQTGDNAYKAISKAEDAASIAAYGEKEKPYLFFFDFVTLSAMANDVRDFYLARYKTRKKTIEMEVFLDNAEVEFADALTIVPQSSLLCEVQKVNIYPGSGKEDRNDRINLVVKEY